MIKLYSKNESFIGNLENCIECVVEEERNGLFELILTYPVIGDLYLSLEKENIIIADANDTLKAQKFRIYNVRKYMKNQVTIYARHISFDLMHDVIENEISFTNQSCEYALNEIFRNSISSKHYKGFSNIVNAQKFKVSKINCLSAIAGAKGSIIDTFGTGAEILRDNTNIHVLNKRGHDNGVSIEYRKNLIGLEVEEDTTDLVTRIIPYATQKVGEEEKVINYNGYVDAPNINAFSKPYSAWIDYSDKFEQDEEVTQEKLKIYAEREYTVNKRHIPKCNYKIEFIPLSKVVGYKELEDKISLCDTVTIKDTRYGIDTQAKVIKTVYNVLLGRYDSMELGEPKTTLGDVITNNGGSNNSGSNNGGTGGSDSEKVEIDDSNFPNIIPLKPVLSSNVMGFGSVEVSWTFENKSYFKYELYASKVKDFTPNSFYLIYSGQASAFLHVVEPNETWYYRVCGINSHGNRGEFSEQLTVNTTKLDDFEQYFSSLAVKNLVANMFSADYIKAGQIKGTWIDARNLTVTDGNGKRTLDIDSFGNVALDVTSLKISSSDISNYIGSVAQSKAEQTYEGFKQTVEEKYLDKNTASTTYASKSDITQSASQIKHEISQIYPTNESVSNSFSDLDRNLQNTYATKTLVTQTADSITQSVSKKVGKDEIISVINQTAETIQIQANKINLDGYTFVSSQLSSPNITGNALVYIEKGGILSCDGETYATKLLVTDLARDCHFSSDAPAYFNNTLLAKKGLTASDRIHAKNGISVDNGITANGNMILNGYTVIKNNSLGVESNIYCTNGTIEAKYLKVNNSGTVSGTLSVTSTLYAASLEVLKYGTILKNLTVNEGATLKGYISAKNSVGIDQNLYVGGNIEALDYGYGQINCRYLGSHGNIVALGNLTVSGSKNCVQETENFGKRLINAYETCDYYFGDIGESQTINGESTVWIDDIFKEIISTEVDYQVFITKYGRGDIWVEERAKDYFVVKSENDISFGWEIKGKRKGYEKYRLEEYVEEIPGGKEDVQENNAI